MARPVKLVYPGTNINAEFVDFLYVCARCGADVTRADVKKPSCPSCGYGEAASDWKKPPIETALFLLQKDFKETGNKELLGNMFLILHKYALGMVKRSLGGKVIYSEEMLHEKATDAANAMIERYLEEPDYLVRDSFAGTLWKKVISVLYKYKLKKIESTEVLHGMENQTDHKIFHEAMSFTRYLPFEREIEDKSILDSIRVAINEGVDAVELNFGKVRAAQVLFGIFYYISTKTTKKGEKTQKQFYEFFGGETTKEIVDALMVDILHIIKGR